MGGYSYGNWARTPEEVQRANGIKSDFDKVKERYENIKPLRGVRKVLDIRPSGERNRAWERVVKVSDTEYYLSCTSWGYFGREGATPQDLQSRKNITYKQEGMVETIILHTPRWGMTSPSIYYFYDCNLPKGMNMESYKGKKYVRVDDGKGGYNYYRADKGDATFYRPKGGTYWTALHVHREVKHKLNRKKTKEIREKLKPFIDYAKIMFPLVEPSGRHYGSVLDKNWEELITQKTPNEIPESWITAVSQYKQRLHRWVYNSETKLGEYTYCESSLVPKIQREAYRVEKPFDVEVVPLGELSHDPYKSWIND